MGVNGLEEGQRVLTREKESRAWSLGVRGLLVEVPCAATT